MSTLTRDLHESVRREDMARLLWATSVPLSLRTWHELSDEHKQRYRDAAALALRWLDPDYRELAVYAGALALHADAFGSPDLRRSTLTEQRRELGRASVAQRGALDVLTGRAPERIQQAKSLREQMKHARQDENEQMDRGALPEAQDAIVLQMKDARRI